MRRKLSLIITVILSLLILSIGAAAQETTGEIQGSIKDATGAVVPNVTVTIKGKDVGITRTAQTDSDGFFRIRQIPPGTYTVTSEAASGFVAQTKENVQVGLGNATTVDFTAAASAGTNVVNVNSSDSGVIVDPTETKAQDNISAREIDALPKTTGFVGLLKVTASVRPEPLSGQLSINGSTGPENSFIIDGQETQNFKNGLINANNDIPYQSVQEIQVKTSGFEAEFGGATGGVINAVTKSGSNQFHGEFGVNLSTQKLNATPAGIYSLFRNTSVVPNTSANSGQGIEIFPVQKDGGTSFFPTGLASGPIVKDKLWFFAIHSPRIINVERTTNFVSGFGPTRTPTVLSPALIAAGASTTETSKEKTTYNYSQFRLDASPTNKIRISSSFTWNPIVDQGALLSYQNTSILTTNVSAGNNYVIGSPSTLVANGQTYQGQQAANFKGGRQNSNNFRVEGVYTPTSKLVLLGRYTRGFQNEKLISYGIPSDTQYICQQVTTALQATAGCVQGFTNISGNNGITRNVSLRSTYDVQGSYLFNAGGHHELKGGYQRSTIFNDVLSGNLGTGRTYLYYGITCFDPTFLYASQWAITAGNNYPCPSNSIGTGVTYQFGASGKATNTADTLFIQDKWQPTSRLTFNLGLRDEQEKIPAFNQNSINLKFPWKDKLAPRLGVAYALTADGKTKLSAFYGRFFDRLKFALPLGSFGGNFYHVSYFYITANNPSYTAYNVSNLKGSYAFPAGGTCPLTSGTAYVCDQDYRIASNVVGADPLTNGAVDPNIKPYRQSEATVEFQREVMRATVFTARGLYRHLDQAIEDSGIPTAAGEAYVIGNPGQGLAAQLYKQLGYNIAPKPIRNYKALQLEMDSRYIKNFSLNLNYTLSRLWGNYSGLADPDEISTSTGLASGLGRTDPNVGRDFDEPWVGFTASGKSSVGILPLDRTHVFKASGTYTYGWFNSKTNSTDLSFFTTAESGTPLTTFVNIFSVSIPETKRGDLGRTPVFTQTDLNLSHKYKFGRDNRFTAAFDFNVLNAFNENNVLAVNQNKNSGYFNLAPSAVCASGTKVCATNVLTSQGVLSQYAAAENSFTVSGAPGVFGVNAARNVGFKQPVVFQAPRSIRFGFRLMF